MRSLFALSAVLVCAGLASAQCHVGNIVSAPIYQNYVQPIISYPVVQLQQVYQPPQQIVQQVYAPPQQVVQQQVQQCPCQQQVVQQQQVQQVVQSQLTVPTVPVLNFVQQQVYAQNIVSYQRGYSQNIVVQNVIQRHRAAIVVAAPIVTRQAIVAVNGAARFIARPRAIIVAPRRVAPLIQIGGRRR